MSEKYDTRTFVVVSGLILYECCSIGPAQEGGEVKLRLKVTAHRHLVAEGFFFFFFFFLVIKFLHKAVVHEIAELIRYMNLY